MTNVKFPVPYEQLVNLKSIIPYENNAKLHDERGVERIVRAITSTGYFDQPIVVDENNVIIKGHGRRLASIKLGLSKVWVVKNTEMSEVAKKASRLQDNLVARGDMDESILYSELEEIAKIGGFDFEDLGLNEIELEEFNNAFVFDDEDYLNKLDGLGDEIKDVEEKEEKDVKLKAENYEPSLSVVVECENEDQQRQIYNRMTAEGFTCKIMSV
jgi:ParB-like chromosome segregation protein Spo0J